MTDPVAAPQPHQAHHHDPGFWRTYVFSTDHKMIGKQFLSVSLLMLVVGGLLAMLIRYQLAWPNTPVPGLGWVPEPQVVGGVMSPSFYNSVFTMHATIMIFFAVMPILIGSFGNFLIPLMIGARDMAFPVLNMLSFWVAVVASIIMIAGFLVPGGHAAAGWTSYAPLSAVAAFLYGRPGTRPISCMPKRTRRFDGFRPSRTSGSARPMMTDIA